MAALDSTRTAPFGATTTYRVVQFFASTGEHLRRWNDARITQKSLHKLSDRELNDIGLSRADVNRIAFGGKI